MDNPKASDCQKNGFYTFLRLRKGLGNNCQHICCANASHKWLSACLGGVMFSKWNPQPEFISGEENSEFQGIFMPMERTVYTYSKLVKILILTKGAGFSGTLSKGFKLISFRYFLVHKGLHNY